MYTTWVRTQVLKAKFHKFLKNENLNVVSFFSKFKVNIVEIFEKIVTHIYLISKGEKK